MTYDDIRKLYIESGQSIKMLAISSREQAIIHFVNKNRKATAGDIAVEFFCSIQNASTSLKRLCEKGYMYRTEGSHSSGGLEYEYSVRTEVGGKSRVKTISNTSAHENR